MSKTLGFILGASTGLFLGIAIGGEAPPTNDIETQREFIIEMNKLTGTNVWLGWEINRSLALWTSKLKNYKECK